MSSEPPQKITLPTEDDYIRLRDQRAVVERYLGNEASKEKYKTAAGKLGTIRAILQAGVFKPDQTSTAGTPPCDCPGRLSSCFR